MNENIPLTGRTLAVASDFSIEEQRFLYKETRRFKEAWLNGGDLSSFRIEDPELTVYLMFLENSTRTKESFRNAAHFHNVILHDFNAASSSFQKNESLVDTVKMLVGYSRSSIFILRTKMEGVCRALEEQLAEYAARMGRKAPVFINGGDGRHEHPTQEYLDEFTFLEQLGWNDSHIHLALVGDLCHGRTVHSKADGLKVFNSVLVDLVAPEELVLPDEYITRMRNNGFELRMWESIDEYLASPEVSNCWYFTRLQLERMGDDIREKEDKLRKMVTFRKDQIDKLPEQTLFYHPLPRHCEKPVIPTFLDKTSLNGWDIQSVNGFFSRVIELALVGGNLGKKFRGQGLKNQTVNEQFVEEVQVTKKNRIKDNFKVGIKPVDNGLVIDHIARGRSEKEIWNHIDTIRRILNLNVPGSHGVFYSMNGKTIKGLMSLPDITEIEERNLRKLAAVSPGCSVNLIENRTVKKKYRLDMPPYIYNFEEISCKNTECITWPSSFQHIPPHFYRSGKEIFTCRYCNKSYSYGEIWDI